MWLKRKIAVISMLETAGLVKYAVMRTGVRGFSGATVRRNTRFVMSIGIMQSKEVRYMAEYTVYYEGKITIEADNDTEATGKAYEELKQKGLYAFRITGSEED